jgi:hypothetical protein
LPTKIRKEPRVTKGKIMPTIGTKIEGRNEADIFKAKKLLFTNYYGEERI